MKYWLSVFILTMCSLSLQAHDFDEVFCDSTIRIDYVLGGNINGSAIFVDDINKSAGWFGRRVNLSRPPLLGNGQFYVTDPLTSDTLYANSFTTLYLEWLATPESRTISRCFEHPILMPMPKRPLDVTMQLINMHQDVIAKMTFRLEPEDILIRRTGNTHLPYDFIGEMHDPRQAIDIVFLPEGYTQDEMPLFLEDCVKARQSILEHSPYDKYKDRFNFIAVQAPDYKSGNSVPRQGIWNNTNCGSHYDTFYSDRYNTTSRLRQVHELLNGIPYEHIIILTNSQIYGGGGFYNDYCIASAHGAYNQEVIVHEFGHSFGGLADEYATQSSADTYYPTDREPWEQNITTLHDFKSKWQDMLPKGTPVPTPTSYKGYPTNSGEDANPMSPRYTKIGVYEGAGYQPMGVYRPVEDCRMRINQVKNFCPVCQRALSRMIEFYTEPLSINKK